MKTTEARDLTEDQLNDRLLLLKKEQFNLRFQRASGQLEKTSRIGEVRKDIARIKTILLRQKTPRDEIGRGPSNAKTDSARLGRQRQGRENRRRQRRAHVQASGDAKNAEALAKHFHAHDEKDAYKIGDLVQIQECPPKSKLKRWEVIGLGSKA